MTYTILLFWAVLTATVSSEELKHHDKHKSNLTLEFVQIVWRHGDRSPIMFYPNDPYYSFWPQIPGMLTQEGMRQHYKFGEYLRKRYMPHFLNPHYIRNETYVMSSNVDRAIESAAANLAAFYKPEDWQVWNDGMKWQPVPVHTIPADEDHFLDTPMEKCPRFNWIDKKFHNSLEYQRYNASISPFLQELSGFLGAPVDLDNNSFIYDNLVCVQAHGLTLPEWATADVMRNFTETANFEFFNLFRTKEQQRLLGGTLLKSIRDVFQVKIDGRSNDSLSDKLVIYSAHDTTIIALTRLLDVFNFQRPPYASAVIFELFSDPANNFFLKVLFKNATTTHKIDPLELLLPSCNFSSPCSWNQFVDNTQNLMLHNWNVECRLPFFLDPISVGHEGGHVLRFLVLAVVFIMGTFGVFCTIELYCCYVKRKIIDPAKLKLDITFYSSEDVQLNNGV